MALNLTLKQLRALREVAETRNFTLAAQRLHTTQSALSASIRQLEESLGLKLIARTTRRFALTSAGEEFLPAVARILDDLGASVANLATLAKLKRGSVTIACPPVLAATLLPSRIWTFRERYPQIDFSLKDAASNTCLDKLKNAEVEIAIGSLAVPDNDVRTTPFVTDRLVAVVRESGGSTTRRTITWSALGAYPILAPSTESSTRTLIQSTFEDATGKRFTPVLETSYWLTTIAMVEAGLGVAVVPSHALTHISLSRVRVLELTRPVVTRAIAIMTHRSRTLSPAATAFVRHLLDE